MSFLFPIQTPRLILRPFVASDQDALLAYYQLPEVARYLLEDPWTPEDAGAQCLKRQARTGLETEAGALALVWEYEGRVMGDAGLWLTDGTRQVAEIGWVMHPDFAGRGLATEAVRPLLDLAFGHYGLHRVTAQMDARNLASARLCERLGLRREAHFRQDYWSKGEWTDTFVYAVLGAEWKP